VRGLRLAQRCWWRFKSCGHYTVLTGKWLPAILRTSVTTSWYGVTSQKNWLFNIVWRLRKQEVKHKSKCRRQSQISIRTYLLTYLLCLLTPWSRVLQKLTGPQLVTKSPAFNWNPKDHYRIHNCPPPVPILSKIIPIHAAIPFLEDPS
jgi:hypothetical protein